MATIGQFTKTQNGFTGAINTLAIKADATFELAATTHGASGRS